MSNNNVRQSLESFRDSMSVRIKERLARPTIAQGVQEQNERQTERRSAFLSEFKADQATYIIMGISAVFTAVLGLILGLAPEHQIAADGSTSIFFHTDLIHWIIALIYSVAFVAVTEGAFLVAKNRFHTREEGNNAQAITMGFMLFLAGVSIIGTGWAGGTIGASVLGFLTEFRTVPPSAQKWVVGVVPVLLALYAILLTIYRLSSQEEKSKRITGQMKRSQQLDHRLQMDMAELEGDEMLMLAEMQAYLKAVESGALSAGEAMAAKRAGKTLRQLETEKGRDFDGDGVVGDVPNTRSSTPVSRPEAPHATQQGQQTQYTLSTFLSASGLKTEQAFQDFLNETESFSKAWQVLRDGQKSGCSMPAGMTHRNFNELAGSVNPTIAAAQNNGRR